MSITNLLSGISSIAGSLVGSGAAAVKFLRDDKDSRYPPEYLMYKDMLKQFSKYPCMGFNPMMNFNQMMMMGMNPLTGFNFMNQNQLVQQMLMQQLQNAMAQQVVVQPAVTVPPQGTVQFNNIQNLVQEIVQQVLQRQQQQYDMRRNVSVPTNFIQPPPLMLPMNPDPPVTQIPVITIPRTIPVQPINNTSQVIVNGRAPVPIEPVQAVSIPGGEELSWNNNSQDMYSISRPSNYIGNVL